MWDSILESYRDPLFWDFPIMTSLVSMGCFVLFATPLTWLALRDPDAFRKYRIQKKRPDPRKILGPSVVSWLANNAVMTVLVVLAWPILISSGVHNGALDPWYVVVLQVMFFIVLDDFLFYWMHRGLHHDKIFRYVHVKHHRMTTPWACTAHYMHPVEFVMTGSLALLGPILLGAHVVTVWIWIAWRQWEAAEGHCGYDLPWSPSHILPRAVYSGVDYHDFHHAKFKGNYAGFLSYLDGIFGEYARGYKERQATKRTSD